MKNRVKMMANDRRTLFIEQKANEKRTLGERWANAKLINNNSLCNRFEGLSMNLNLMKKRTIGERSEKIPVVRPYYFV